MHHFYERAAADESLQAIFKAAIQDWDAHHRVVENFWSRTLLETDRYQGSPSPSHARLLLQPEHFEHWLTLFRETAQETLPMEAAQKAIARAEHMAESFNAGMFTSPTKSLLRYGWGAFLSNDCRYIGQYHHPPHR